MKKNAVFLCLITILTISNSLLGEHYNPFSRENRIQKHEDQIRLYKRERQTTTNPYERAKIEKKMAHKQYKKERLEHQIEAKRK